MINSFVLSIKENRVFFSVFLLNSLAGYLSVYLSFWYSLFIFLLNDFVLLSLLGGLKEKIKGERAPAVLRMAGYGKKYYLKGIVARFIVLIFAALVVFMLFNVVGSDMDAFYMMLYTALSLVGFFLVFFFTSLIHFDFGFFQSIIAAFRIFTMQRGTLQYLLALIIALSCISVKWPNTYFCLAVFLTVTVCCWFIYITTFQFLWRMEAQENNHSF